MKLLKLLLIPALLINTQTSKAVEFDEVSAALTNCGGIAGLVSGACFITGGAINFKEADEANEQINKKKAVLYMMFGLIPIYIGINKLLSK